MNKRILLTLLTLAGVASGCSSITGSQNQSVSLQTREQGGAEVSGAACELTNDKGKWFITSPGSVMIHRSNNDMQVLCNKAGLEPGRAAVASETKGSMFGNILFGGGIGAIIDHSNGSAYEYPAIIQVLMGAFSKQETSTIQGQETNAAPGTVPSPAKLASNTPTLDESLKELKRLSDSGLISQEVYVERQRKLLEAR